jgi:predicted naringenin-chalcone synthase
MTFLSGFQQLRPEFELKQEEILHWLAEAHAHVGSEPLREKLIKAGAGSDKIATRGAVLSDFGHTDWDRMNIYALNRQPEGLSLKERMVTYEKVVDQVFEDFYPKGTPLPSHLIHVSCTGYVSPSGAQKLVSRRSQGATTTVTHAYHMGCYASLPALRMAQGFASSVDIVHTELCSLHLNPSLHEMEQLVVQMLFGDGFIKYRISPQCDTPSYQLLSLHEEIISDSIESMFWKADSWGFKMKLAKEIPVSIAKALPPFLTTLAEKAGYSLDEILSQAIFAIHPGGPKIIDQIASRLNLSPEQYHHSQAILKKYGNMSSATLPHVWQLILEEKTIPNETLVVSLAFGPGLTISGGILKICGL